MILGFVVALAFSLGCLAALLLVPEAAAETARGAGFSECFGATLYATPGQELNRNGPPSKTLRIPQGWTPFDVVGPATSPGAGTTTHGGLLVLCR